MFGSGKHFIYINPDGQYLCYVQGHADVCVTADRWTNRIEEAKVFSFPLQPGYELALANKVGGSIVRREVELHIVGDVTTIAPSKSRVK